MLASEQNLSFKTSDVTKISTLIKQFINELIMYIITSVSHCAII